MNKIATIAGLAVAATAMTASAGTYNAAYNFDGASTGGAAGVMVSDTFSLGAVASIDSISMDLSATWGGDFTITLVAPDSTTFTLMLQEDSGTGFGGAWDMGQFAGDGSIGNTDLCTFVESGGIGIWDDLSGFAASGTYDATAWQTGGWAAGDWTFSVSDNAAGDEASIGSVAINYTVPAPGALALLGLGGIAAGRRRRA